eukprot:1150277-Pelagomonas_calceolata.AAC.6
MALIFADSALLAHTGSRVFRKGCTQCPHHTCMYMRKCCSFLLTQLSLHSLASEFFRRGCTQRLHHTRTHNKASFCTAAKMNPRSKVNKDIPRFNIKRLPYWNGVVTGPFIDLAFICPAAFVTRKKKGEEEKRRRKPKGRVRLGKGKVCYKEYQGHHHFSSA